MKSILLCCALLSATSSIIAQKTTYLIVRIDAAKNTSQDIFYKINAEPGNPFASDIYALAKYNTQKGADNSTSGFFAKQDTSNNSLYNYFSTPTEALLFLSQKGWQLISVGTEIFSGNTSVTPVGSLNYYPITTVSSRAVYYLKKDS